MVSSESISIALNIVTIYLMVEAIFINRKYAVSSSWLNAAWFVLWSGVTLLIINVSLWITAGR